MAPIGAIAADVSTLTPERRRRRGAALRRPEVGHGPRDVSGSCQRALVAFTRSELGAAAGTRLPVALEARTQEVIVFDASLLPRLMAKVDTEHPSGCWRWTATLTNTGYGAFGIGGRSKLAHRVMYEILVGPIPEGLVIDHICRHRWCVKPEHLEPVTHAENIRRGDTGRRTGQLQRDKTHCPRHHPYDDVNTYWTPAGNRQCRRCRADRQKEIRRERRWEA